MDIAMQVKELLDQYISFFPEEESRLVTFVGQLDNNEDVISRSNFTGHVTASAFIVNPKAKTVLLLHHNVLQKYLQPGGHIDQGDKSILDATYREMEEETGLTKGDVELYTLVEDEPGVPLDIDSHFIPENPEKGEPSHYHHDFRYLFFTTIKSVKIDENESNQFKWSEFEDFKSDSNFTVASRKIEKLYITRHK